MDGSTPGLPVHHQLPELTQTHVHRVGDAIQPCHPLLSPSPLAFNLSWHQGLFYESALCMILRRDHVTQENFLCFLEQHTAFEIHSGWSHELLCSAYFLSLAEVIKLKLRFSLCVSFFSLSFPCKRKMERSVYRALCLWLPRSSLLLLLVVFSCPPTEFFGN